MPELSVVVHGPNTQDRLTGLLDSLAGHPHGDVEVVVAAVGAWAEETARRHTPDLLVVPLPEGTGDAAARAAGAARASGRWLHFVHSADGLPAGGPRLVAERVAELPDDVDVLLFDHVRSTWETTGLPSPDGRALARAGRAPRLLDDVARSALRVTPLLGNRALRASFWRAHEERLTAGDEAFAAYAVLLLAGQVAACDQVAYLHHELRPESLPPVAPEDRYALVDRYTALLDLARERAAARPGAAARVPYSVLYDVMVRTCLRTFARTALPDAVAREFFRRAADAAVRYRPPEYRRPAGPEGMRRALLEDNAYGGYRAFQAANRARRTTRTAVRSTRRRIVGALGDRRYRAALSRPVDPGLAVFAAYWYRGVACNPAAIAAKLTELAPQIHPVWVVTPENAALLPPHTDHVLPGTPRYREVLATAKYLVNNVNFPNAVVKRPDAVHLQTHHGTPLKRMGVDQMDFPAAAKGLDFPALLSRIDKWDFSVSANSHSTRMWERAYPSRFVSLDHGYPRNDVYYRATAADIRAIRARLGIAPERRAILYAPTHRDYEAGWTPRLDLATLADRLGEDTVLLVRGHYFYDGTPSPLTALRRTGRIIDVSSYDPVEDLALAADVLVTDYSSIMFDYANLDRPIVVYADDWETYRSTRGVYFDLMAEPPGQVARTQAELTEILTTEAWQDEGAAKARAAFRRRFCEYDDGHAAERVVRRVFLGESEDALPPVVPLEDRTPAPSPREAV
ncbi:MULTISPECIES: CDP-glycerol glycerophosphotransferase family protein [unclassified Streptomyces]|uniref:CDP-glycerol glycerophosphotransferase family protein n=1 Tax=unclassified Streptomyces TaxID=2593676 RepID=UPI00074A0FBD|nr:MULTISPECIES: CDP-glycerol glycerophosphotransferase family protein [unclassified Streptomyces]KUL74302.1 transferase [Streptomyces sp. NRRL WC-3605]KUL75081.1 transferase [Streptomyces sp. NRRL WC-3604]